MDIQCLPYFLKDDRFTTQNKDRIHQACLYSTYYATLLLDLMGSLKTHSPKYRARVHRSLRETRRVLTGILWEMKNEKENGDIPMRFLHRLESVGAAWQQSAKPRKQDPRASRTSLSAKGRDAYKILSRFGHAEGKIPNGAYLAIPQLHALDPLEIDVAVSALEAEGCSEPNMEIVYRLADGAQSRRLIATKTGSGFVDWASPAGADTH
jgi:hypothetical protein